MKEKLYRFMQGRYGSDQFNRFLVVVSMVTLLVSAFTSSFFYTISLALLAYTYFRMFSRNYYKRSEENRKYLQMTAGLRSRWAGQKSIWQQRKTHHIYRCPSCRQKIRVPRGKGKIEIRCPKCQTLFVKKS